MPFFGGGGAGDYHIVATNIKGGTGAAPAIIGDNNMALGNGSLAVALNSDDNIAVGNGALGTITNWSGNVAVGHLSGNGIDEVLYSTLVGANSGYYSSVRYSVVIGNSAGANYDAPGNTHFLENSVLIGTNALPNGGVDINSVRDVYIGTSAGENVIRSQQTVFIGASTYSSDNDIRNSVCIGAYSGVGGDGAVVVGSSSGAGLSAVAIGFNADADVNSVSIGLNSTAGSSGIAIGKNVTAPANEIIIGDSSATNIKIGGIPFTGTPSETYKISIAEIKAQAGLTAFSAIGAVSVFTGTASAVSLTGANVWRGVPCTYLVSAGTAGSSASATTSQPVILTPNNTYNSGGFSADFVFAFDDATNAIGNNGRIFCGLSSNALPLSNSDPSSWTDALIGICSNAGDANASLIYNFFLGTPTLINLGADFAIAPYNTPAIWSVHFRWMLGDTAISYTIKRRTNTNLYQASGTIPLIDNSIAMRPFIWRNNAAIASAVRVAIAGISVQAFMGFDSPI
jgi:hypothetical protein